MSDAFRRIVAEATHNRKTTAEVVAEALRRAILEGALSGGERLRQNELASQFGVSRMPIREALRLLETEGLVTAQPHRGYTVTQLSPEQVGEIYEMRTCLEAMAARLAAPLLSDDDLSALEALYDAMRGAADVATFLRLNRAFHGRIYAASGRRRLCDLIDRLRDEVEPYLRVYLSLVRQDDRGHEDHAAILEACRLRDPDLAARRTSEHLSRIAEGLSAFLRGRARPAGVPALDDRSVASTVG